MPGLRVAVDEAQGTQLLQRKLDALFVDMAVKDATDLILERLAEGQWN